MCRNTGKQVRLKLRGATVVAGTVIGILTIACSGRDAGVRDHEWLFWDNQTYMKQLGLTK